MRTNDSLRREFGTLRNDAVFREAPERDQELSREGDDAASFDALADSEPRHEPVRELAVGLVPQPSPGELDDRRSPPPIAGLTDALAAVHVAARERYGDEAGDGANLAPVLQVSPVEELAAEDVRTVD